METVNAIGFFSGYGHGPGLLRPRCRTQDFYLSFMGFGYNISTLKNKLKNKRKVFRQDQSKSELMRK